MTARTPGTAKRTSGRAWTSVWKPFSYWTRPQETISGWSLPWRLSDGPGPQSSGSTPFGTTLTLSAGSWKAPTTSSRMKVEQQMTWVASYVSHHSTLLMAVDCPGDRWPPPRPRSVAWIVATRGAPQLTCRVLLAQATSQSWACTTSGRQPSRRAAAADKVVVGPGHVGDEEVVGEPGQSARARTTRTPSTTSSSGRPGGAG